jgi:hypothetical protein
MSQIYSDMPICIARQSDYVDIVEQDAEKVRQPKKTVVWFVWSVWFFG